MCIKLAQLVFFSANPFSLKELIGYVDLTISREIWLEHSLVDVQKNESKNWPVRLKTQIQNKNQ